MKKILFTSLTGFPNPSIGGPTRIIYELLKNLDYSEFEPYFLSYDMFKKYLSTEDLNFDQNENIYAQRNLGFKLYNKIKFYRSVVTSRCYLKYHYQKKDKYFFNFVNKFENFDVIHSHDLLSASYFLGLKKPKKILTIHSKGTQVSEMRESDLRSSYFNELLLKFSKRELNTFLKFDIITFPSKAAKEIFLQDLDLDEIKSRKIEIIYNGIDLERIKNIKGGEVLDKYKIAKNDYDFTILNVAQHVKPKNIGLIIQSIKILNDKYKKKVLLVNVGEGYLTEDYKLFIKANNLNEQVKFLGLIPNEDVIRLMKTLDIFIQTSEKVIFDIVVLEALASGIKVLVSNQGGNKEVIQEGVNGNFIKDLNELSIAKSLLSSFKQNLEISNKTFEKYLTIDRMTKEYKELY